MASTIFVFPGGPVLGKVYATDYGTAVQRQSITGEFNANAELPYELRLRDFEMAMQDVYDFLFDVNQLLLAKGLHRMDDMLRPAAMSGLLSDMLTASVANIRVRSSRIATSTVIPT